MNVLVACEFSGTVRDAFIRAGHDAVSCDLLPSESAFGPHIQGDAVEAVRSKVWDLIVMHPPCTYFSLAGNRWLHGKYREQRLADRDEALGFVRALIEAAGDTPWAIENPLGTLSSLWRKPDQIINPFDYGDPSRKPTCLWLQSLPPLIKTGPLVEAEIVTIGGKRYPKWHADSFNLQGEERRKVRSMFFVGIANAMAAQWGAR